MERGAHRDELGINKGGPSFCKVGGSEQGRGRELRCRLDARDFKGGDKDRGLVARDFKGGDKDRDDLFAATSPLEAKRILLSRASTRKTLGRAGLRKLVFIDAKKKTHLAVGFFLARMKLI